MANVAVLCVRAYNCRETVCVDQEDIAATATTACW